MQKTQKPNNIPLSQEALNCLQAKDDLDEPVFTLPASDATVNYHVKKLIKAAGIEKKVSFHCTRHTFAVHSLHNLVSKGEDTYCIMPILSKFLGHKDLRGTERYVRLTHEIYPDINNMMYQLTANIYPTQSD